MALLIACGLMVGVYAAPLAVTRIKWGYNITESIGGTGAMNNLDRRNRKNDVLTLTHDIVE